MGRRRKRRGAPAPDAPPTSGAGPGAATGNPPPRRATPRRRIDGSTPGGWGSEGMTKQDKIDGTGEYGPGGKYHDAWLKNNEGIQTGGETPPPIAPDPRIRVGRPNPNEQSSDMNLPPSYRRGGGNYNPYTKGPNQGDPRIRVGRPQTGGATPPPLAHGGPGTGFAGPDVINPGRPRRAQVRPGRGNPGRAKSNRGTMASGAQVRRMAPKA